MKIHAWIGTLSSILGAFIVALGGAFIGYSFFTLGAFSWLVVAYRRKDSALALLNATFLVANIIGLVRNF